MILQPATYVCPHHQADLTGQVEEALVVEGSPKLAFKRPSWWGKTSAAPREFEVIVTCPGPEGGVPHTLTCSGSYIP
jgi:hypothetical protein